MRVDLADFDDLFDFSHGDPTRFGTGDIEVVGCFAQDQVAGLVGLPGFDDRKVGGDAFFQDIGNAVVFLDVFPFGEHRTNAGPGKKSRNSGSAGAHFLCQGPLRSQLELQFAAQVLLFEKSIFANIGRNHFFDLAGLQQKAKAEIVNPGVVADHRQSLRAGCAQGQDQFLGYPAETETSRSDGHVIVEQALKGFCCIGVNRFHVLSLESNFSDGFKQGGNGFAAADT